MKFTKSDTENFIKTDTSNSIKSDNINFRERLIYLRMRSGYTQNGLAERAGVSQSHLRRVERGEADITISHLEMLCDAMGISLKDFFNIDEEKDEFSTEFSKLSPKQKGLLLEFFKTL